MIEPQRFYDESGNLRKSIRPLLGLDKIEIIEYNEKAIQVTKKVVTMEQYRKFESWHNDESNSDSANKKSILKAVDKVLDTYRENEYTSASGESTMKGADVEQPVKRGRGRPRKDATQPKVVPIAERPPKVVNDAQDAILDLLAIGAAQKTKDAITDAVQDSIGELKNYLDILKNDIKAHKHLTITTDKGTKPVKGRMHTKFEDLVKALTTTFPVMLVGSAGSGKTFSSEQAAEALDIPFYAISVGSQTSKSDLLGYMTASGSYVRTAFREAYEHGGLFLLDEIDAGNSNVLIVLNAALSGTFCSFPDGMIRRHENFKCVAAGNTYGTGASRTYVGRNQLDAATLDRFLVFDWPIDEVLEYEIIAEYTDAKRWHDTIKAIRKLVDTKDMRVIVSPRATIKGIQLLNCGFSFDDSITMSVIANAPKDHSDAIKNEANRVWASRS